MVVMVGRVIGQSGHAALTSNMYYVQTGVEAEGRILFGRALEMIVGMYIYDLL